MTVAQANEVSSEQFWRVRTDLVRSRQGTEEEAVWIIKDPLTDRVFRLRAVEMFILDLLDGRTALNRVRELVVAEFDADVPREQLNAFIERLRRARFLAEEGEAISPTRRHRIRGSIFYLRFKAFNPERFLNWLEPRTRWLFSGLFVGTAALAIASAAFITWTQWSEIAREIPSLLTPKALAMAYVAMLGVVASHEVAHGLTCRHFGGRVREMGFMLLFFQPAFYCNVTDAWLFPKKSQRMWVSAAGAFFELSVWAGATWVWLVTEVDTIAHYLALLVMASSGVKSLFNLNPLIKLDGYYLLSDYLEVPNLRQRSFAYLRGVCGRIWGSARNEVRRCGGRERWIYGTYGVAAAVYTYWLLAFILGSFGQFLVTHYEGTGFAFYSVGLVGFFHTPLKRCFQPMTKVLTKVSVWIRRALLLGLLGAGVWALFFIEAPLRVGGSFVTMPLTYGDVRPEVEGIVEAVYFEEGASVEKGTVIARLADRDLRTELEKTTAQIEQAHARLKLLQAGNRPEEIEIARTLRTKADERLKYATSRLEMDTRLYDQQLISLKELEDTREAATLRHNEVQEAADRFRILQAGTREEEIEATQAEINRLQVQRKHLDNELGRVSVRSPERGVLVTPRMKERVGQAVKRGDLLGQVHRMDILRVEIAISEKEIADVQPGQRVVLRAKAFPLQQFSGVVVGIAPAATANEKEQAREPRSIRVITELPNAGGLLKPEMTGHAKIYGEKKRLIDMAARRFVRFFKVEFWSWW